MLFRSTQEESIYSQLILLSCENPLIARAIVDTRKLQAVLRNQDYQGGTPILTHKAKNGNRIVPTARALDTFIALAHGDSIPDTSDDRYNGLYQWLQYAPGAYCGGSTVSNVLGFFSTVAYSSAHRVVEDVLRKSMAIPKYEVQKLAYFCSRMNDRRPHNYFLGKQIESYLKKPEGQLLLEILKEIGRASCRERV